jgi:hypothetical protein
VSRPAREQPARGSLGALQTALGAEEAAIYGYGVAGAHLTGAGYSQAYADSVLHERARDVLIRLIEALGAQPRAAAVAYRLPVAVNSPASARALAARLELDLAAAYLGLAAVDDPALRKLAAVRMQGAAVRAARWGGGTEAFPGIQPTG